jgi:Patatin-like phospholipase
VNWKQIGRFLRTVFLLRIPLATLVLLAAVGPIALTSGEKLLGNLLDARVVRFSETGIPVIDTGITAWYLFSISFAAFLTACTAIAVINLVIHYGRDRFDDPALDLAQKRPLLTFLLGIAAAMPLVMCVISRTRIRGTLPWLISVLGLLSALALVVVAKIVQLAFTDPTTTPHPPPYLVFPVYLVPKLQQFFDNVYCWRSGTLGDAKRAVNRLSQYPLELLRCAGQGFLIDCDAPRGKLALRSGHVFAFALSMIAFAAYFAIGYAKGRIDVRPAVVPAMAFVLLYALVLCWLLGALTFFFDRYRVPLLACLALLVSVTSFAPESDHIYRVTHRDEAPVLLRPGELVRMRSVTGNRRMILVAAAGGGIQAAAWTAQVLHGLEEECKQPLTTGEAGEKCDFRGAVALISAVSGGSLGALSYTRSFIAVPRRLDRRAVIENSAASALDEVAWGWTNPDFIRAVLPWFRRQYIDRGWALEEKWSATNQLRYPVSGRDSFLADWAQALRQEGPALMLNATVVETGEPLVFSTTDFPRAQDPHGLQNFYDLYPEWARKYDVRINTAARLSASFPYVSPAARSDMKSPMASDYHVVDGGYYDNYGINALLGWLDDAIDDPVAPSEVHRDLADVLILQVRPFPGVGRASRSRHGWDYQLFAPVDALLDVRDTGQAAHDRNELKLFTRYNRSRGIHIWRADFEYAPAEPDCARAPLSWKLTQEQTNCIISTWNRFRGVGANGVFNPEIACVIDYLRHKPVVARSSSGTDVQQQANASCSPGDDPADAGGPK